MVLFMARENLFKRFAEAWAKFGKALSDKSSRNSEFNSGTEWNLQISHEAREAQITYEYRQVAAKKALLQEAAKLAHIAKLEAGGESTAPSKQYTDGSIQLRPAFGDAQLQAAHSAAVTAIMKENDPVWRDAHVFTLNQKFKNLDTVDFSNSDAVRITEEDNARAAALIERLQAENKLDAKAASKLLEHLANPPQNTSGFKFSLEDGKARHSASMVLYLVGERAEKAGGNASEKLERVADLVDDFFDDKTGNVAKKNLEKVAESVNEMNMVIANCGRGDEQYRQALQASRDFLVKQYQGTHLEREFNNSLGAQQQSTAAYFMGAGGRKLITAA
jgi:hypothetical protein